MAEAVAAATSSSANAHSGGTAIFSAADPVARTSSKQEIQRLINTLGVYQLQAV